MCSASMTVRLATHQSVELANSLTSVTTSHQTKFQSAFNIAVSWQP